VSRSDEVNRVNQVSARTAQMGGRGIPVVGPDEAVPGLPSWVADAAILENDPGLERAFNWYEANWRRGQEFAKHLERDYSWSVVVREAPRGVPGITVA
jgi:hypothetical protein